ncbi:hypothetical protein BDW75DRAFT_234590 [Aspergillus navahoensis]
MDQPTHVIDPDGEVIIVLRNANSPFAKPSDEMVALEFSASPPESNDNIRDTTEEIKHLESWTGTPKAKPSKKGKKKSKKKQSNIVWSPPGPDLPPIEKPAPEEAPVPEESAAAEEPAPEEPVPEEPVPEEPAPEEAPVPEESAPEEPVPEEPVREEPVPKEPAENSVHGQQKGICFRIQVSAKHLILASPVFKKILTGRWKESIAYAQKGSVEITAESWDLEALLVLLRTIHGQNYLIPRKLTLELLAKVAVLADYYDCREAVDILGRHIWINAMEEAIPSTYCRDLILWLWVSWFFQLPAHFKKASSAAMSLSDKGIDALGLPIPYNVIRSMDDCRQGAIAGILLLLHEIREELLSGSRGCGFECSSIMYGALTKQLQQNALLWPRPEAPFPNLNYKSLVQRVLSFISPEWYGPSWRGATYQQHDCPDSSFESIIGELKDTIEGLDLDSLIHG